MFTNILLVLVAVAAALVVYILLQPNEFRVTRSITIDAPADAVFAQVNDFHNWDAWSPWAKLDPAAKTAFSGAPQGTGAVFAWTGNRKVGVGRMTILDSAPAQRILIKLEFQRPLAGTSTAEFTFTPNDDQTTVNWSMYGTNSFIAKAMGLFIDCDKLIGDAFDQGLANLKAVAEHNLAHP